MLTLTRGIKRQIISYESALRKARKRRSRYIRKITNSKQVRHYHRRSFARDYARVLKGDPCAYCGKQFEVVDHIDSISCGGDPGDPFNLTASCHKCNDRKRAKTLLLYLLFEQNDR